MFQGFEQKSKIGKLPRNLFERNWQTMEFSDVEFLLQGVPISEGIAIGNPFFLNTVEDQIPQFSISSQAVDNEISRYKEALDSSRTDLLKLQSYLAQEGSEDVMQIIDTHIQMLKDPLITTAIEEKIRHRQENIESIFYSVIDEYEQKFTQTQDHFFKQRLTDVIDISKRILSHLYRQNSALITDAPKNSVVMANELVPSDTAAADTTHVKGIVTQEGGFYSHAALIARAKGIPFVSNIDLSKIHNTNIRSMIVDGNQGLVICNPCENTLNKYMELKSVWEREKIEKRLLAHLKSETRDGRSINIHANVGCLEDLQDALDYGASGVGLLRTEYLFLDWKASFPSEEDQYDAFSRIIKDAHGLPIVVRVFDFGGDKTFGPSRKEVDSILSSRGIRFLLRHKELFQTHLRAVLRASEFGAVRILLPLVSDPQEIIATRKLLVEIQTSLGGDWVNRKTPPIGCMIELPSAVMVCDSLAREADFLSLGTNDLIQYALGLDRNHAEVNDLYFPVHPSILQFLKIVVASSLKTGKSLTICGELASNPVVIPLLIGLGITNFSCAPRYISILKRVVRMSTYGQCQELTANLLRSESAPEIFQVLLKEYDALLPFSISR